MLRFIVLNRFRSFFGVHDFYVHVVIFLALVFFSSYVIYPFVADYGFYFLGWAFYVFNLHCQRKDLELLWFLGKKYYWLLQVEYSLYSLPLLVIWVGTGQWYWALAFVALLNVLIWLPQPKHRIWRYPFHVFTPFWIQGFRKYRWLLYYPLLLFLIWKGHQIANPGLYIFSFIIFTLIVLQATLTLEPREHMVCSVYEGKHYWLKKWESAVLNVSLALLPMLLLFVFLDATYLLLWLIALLICFLSVLVKYAFYAQPLAQFIILALLLVGLPFGISLLFIPFFSRHATRQINDLQC